MSFLTQIIKRRDHQIGLENRLRILGQLTGHYQLKIDWEEILAINCRKLIKKGNTVIDVGAHQGFHTQNLLNLVSSQGTVFAFEPIPHLYKDLKKKYQRQKNLKIFPIALSSTAGTAKFILAQGALGESGLKQRFYVHPEITKPQTIKVKTQTIDHYQAQFNRLDYIKIDTEGAEIDIIKGAGKTIQKFRPLISFEYGFGTYRVYNYEWDTIFDLAQSHHYIITDLFGYSAQNKTQWRLMCDKMYWDYFMVPQEKYSWFLHTGEFLVK